MAPAIASTVVEQPAAEVFAYATDPTRFPEWQQGVTGGHLDQPGPPQVGAKCLTTRRIGGANRAVTAELTHIDAPRTWGVQGIDGPIRATVDVTVEPLTETSSRLTIAVDFDAHGIGKLLVPLIVRRQAQKEMPANVEALKRPSRPSSRSTRRKARRTDRLAATNGRAATAWAEHTRAGPLHPESASSCRPSSAAHAA